MIEHLIHLTGTSAMAFGLYLAADAWRAQKRSVSPFQSWLLYSACFGLMVAACIGTGHQLRPGVVLDARGAVLAVATVVGGPAVGAATTGIAMAVRGWLGGAGMWAGLAGLGLEFLVAGLLVWFWRHRRQWSSQLVLLGLAGLAVGVIEAWSLRWIQPPAVGEALFRNGGVELFLTQMICTLLMGGAIQLQRERRRSRTLLEGALSTSLDGFALVTGDGRWDEVNAAVVALVGAPRDRIVGTPLRAVEAGAAWAELVNELPGVQAGARRQFEVCWRRPGGGESDLEITAVPAPAAGGGSYLLFHDVTRHRAAEAALRVSEEQARANQQRLEHLIAATQDGIVMMDPRGCISLWNDAAGRLFGYPRAEALGQHLHRLLAPARYHTAYEQALPGFQATGAGAALGRVLELAGRRRDGTEFPLELSLSPMRLDDAWHAVGILRDITERKRIEESLQETNEYLSNLFNYANAPIIVWDPAFRITRFNRAFEALTGRSASEVIGNSLALLFPDDQVEVSMARIRQTQTGERWETVEIAIVDRAGERHLLLWNSATLFAEDGRTPVATIAQGHDVTKRHEAEAALRASEDRYRLLSESGTDFVWLFDPATGHNLYASPSVERLTGYTVAETLARPLPDLVPPESLRLIEEQWRVRVPAFEAGDPSVRTRSYELELKCRDGSTVPVESVTTLIPGADGRVAHLLGVSRDISERKRTERALGRQRDLGIALMGTDGLEEGLRLCLETAREITGLPAGGLYYAEESGALRLVCHYGLSASFVAAVSWLPAGAPQVQWARQGRPFHGSVDTFGLPPGAVERQEGLRMLSFLPISRGERLLAVLNLVSFEDRELPFARRHLLESIAHLAGTFIDRFQAQAALRRAHAELEERVVQRTAEALDLYHHAPCGYHSLAPDGRVLQMNDTELAWLGYRREEVEGRMNLADLLLPASAQEFQAGLARLAAGEPTLKLEAAMRRQDGTSFTVLLTSEAEQDAEGRCGKIRATAIDISERRRVEAVLRASEERHRDLVETVPDWVWETNERGVYVFCGPQARELFGYEPDELLGRTPFDLMPAEEARRVAGLVGPLMARGEAIRGLENVARRKDGSLVTLETNGVPVRDAEGRLTGYRGLDHDLTERKQIEAQLLQAKEAADAANQAKSRFLANMSHEIRTPMNAILGFAQVLQRDPTLNPRQQQHLTTINRSGEHLLRLINDILDMSKIEAGRMILAPADCDFHGLVDDLTSMFRHRTEERELAFAVAYAPDVPRFIHTDGGKVRQVLLNLLSNAVKFTAQGGIRVGLAAQKLAPGPMRPARCRIQVEVADTGAGIAPEELESVFEAFEQTRVGRRQGGGTGLGMAISRQLARMLGGDLTVTSQVGVGSTFVFTFVTATLDPGDRPVAAEAPRRVVGLAPGRPAPVILVVDDNEVNRELLRQLLVLIGFEVHEATNGTEAVSRCAAGPPALVLMDRHMPGLDGLAATRAIRNLPLPEPPPILIVSANVLGTPAEEWRAAGADGFISKPFREEELLAEIGRWVPVEYVYEAPPGAPAPALAELREQVAGLAPDLRDLLVRTTQSGDITRLRRLIQQEVLPLQPDLGQALSLLSENFDYEAILRLLTPPPEA